MKYILFILVALIFTACRKEAVVETKTGQAYSNPVSSNAVNAVPINQSVTFPIDSYIYNACAGEYIHISGTLHYKLRGMISNNKITYVLHYNYSNVIGEGLNSRTKYIANGAFNYSNTDNFGGQFVYQQSSSFNYISVDGLNSFKIINDWHLTVNANGEVTFFFTTEGDVLICA